MHQVASFKHALQLGHVHTSRSCYRFYKMTKTLKTIVYFTRENFDIFVISAVNNEQPEGLY